MRLQKILLGALIAYIVILFFFAVLIRDAKEVSSVKLDLFWDTIIHRNIFLETTFSTL